MKYNDPFNYSPNDEVEQHRYDALLYTIGVIFMLLVGLIGNGVL